MFQHSNCCNAGVYENTDICMSCKEHCEVIQDEVAEWRATPVGRAYQDAINAVDMMTAMLEDLRDNLKKINQQLLTPVGKEEDQQ